MNLKYFIPVLFFNCFVFSQNLTTYTYAIKGIDTLKMDVYSPKKIKKTDSLPVLLWMHGGGFSGGKRDNVDEVKMMKYLATKGYIGISINYRLLRKDDTLSFGCNCPRAVKLETFKQATIDYLDAAKFVFENRLLLQVDVSHIIAGGSSAGAEGILNAVYMKEYFIDDLKEYTQVKFAGVFSLAGAVVNADYITSKNALPTVMFHGTADDLVPFGSAAHHYCTPEEPGYLMLDGSETIAKKLDNLGKAFYLNKVIGGKHELASIPFDQLQNVLRFFEKTIFKSEIIQTKKIITKNP
ncbi:alpha/beta hydrolase [Changchengzhania lutea]|uniref:alpha/beta hydrolase n=1 Tax=Changchengzhania lutea TaxID=2049305 RepID=UPI00115E7DAC|nr:carboxylesterase family protein [Changchengzhania lutea]